MSSTAVALVYSSSTGRLRSWIVPGDDSQLHGFVPANRGEAVLVITREQYDAAADLFSLQALINFVTGKSPSNEDRYADIDAGGNVVSVLYACPNCGDAPSDGLTRIQHNTVPAGAFFVESSYFVHQTRLAGPRRFIRRRKIPY